MKDQINQIKQKALEEILNTQDLKTLNDVKVKYLGKKGELTSVLRGMGGLSPEERPIIGAEVNKAKEEIESLVAEQNAAPGNAPNEGYGGLCEHKALFYAQQQPQQQNNECNYK